MIKEKIYNSFNLAYEDYNLKAKSNHWEIKNKDFLNKVKKINLEDFRKKNILSDGLDDQGVFFRLVENLIDLTDLCGKKFINRFKENNIGNPDNIYVINGEIYNYNDLFIIQFPGQGLVKMHYDTLTIDTTFADGGIYSPADDDCKVLSSGLAYGIVEYHNGFIYSTDFWRQQVVKINSVKIKIEKPDAIADAQSVGVEVFKSRSDYEGS